MAPIKFEETLREKLEKRELQPSDKSWSDLSNRLDVAQRMNNSTLFWWMGVAASIVGILFVTSMFLNNPAQIQIEPGFVKTDVPKNPIKATPSKQPLFKVSNPVTAVKTQIEAQNQEKAKSINQKVNAQNILATTKTSSVIAEIEDVKKLSHLTDSEKSSFSFEEMTIQNVVLEINELKKKGNMVSESEIDSLLKKAQQDITNHKLYNKNTKMVDADALLQGVEADLQQSFRTKVFEALKSSYVSVKTAVVERNN